MPKLVGIHVLFEFFISNADYRITRIKTFLNEALKKGQIDSDQIKKCFDFSVYFVQRYLTFELVVKKYIIKDLQFKKNYFVTLKLITTAIGMCFYQKSTDNILNELRFFLKQFQNGAIASSIVILIDNFLNKINFDILNLKSTDNINELIFLNSCPKELLEHFINELGYEKTKQILNLTLKIPKVTFRLNTIILSNNKLKEEFLNKFCEKYDLEIKEVFKNMPFYECNKSLFNFMVTDLVEYKKGYITPMGVSAYLASYLLDVKQNDLILDACSAPGNKATHILEMLNSNVTIIALDQTDSKINKINSNVKRLNLKNIYSICCDAEFLNYEHIYNYINDFTFFDKIMVDAPCSGLGLLQNRIELKYRFTIKDLEIMPKKQLAILNNVSKFLKPNGYLLYSTCTINKKENEEVINKFLEQNTNFSVVKIKDKIFSLNYNFDIVEYNNNSIQILPDGLAEGFFYALLYKNY